MFAFNRQRKSGADGVKEYAAAGFFQYDIFQRFNFEKFEQGKLGKMDSSHAENSEDLRIICNKIGDIDCYLNNNTGIDPHQFLFSQIKLIILDIEKHIGLKCICLFHAFIEKPLANCIIDTDVVDAIYDKIDLISDDVDEIGFIIHSSGGFFSETKKIVDALRNRFKKIVFIVPHTAMSAATLMIFSGNQIFLSRRAILGPTDPQFKLKSGSWVNLPVYVETLKDILWTMNTFSFRNRDSISDYRRDEINAAIKNALRERALHKKISLNWMMRNLFGQKGFIDVFKSFDISDIYGYIKTYLKAKKIVNFFFDESFHMSHNIPISINEVISTGLPVNIVEKPLDALLWELYLVHKKLFVISNILSAVSTNENTIYSYEKRNNVDSQCGGVG